MGIGLGAALRLARAGASVAITGRRPEAGVAAVAEIEAAGGRAVFIQSDVSDTEDAKRAKTPSTRRPSDSKASSVSNSSRVTFEGGHDKPSPDKKHSMEDKENMGRINQEGTRRRRAEAHPQS